MWQDPILMFGRNSGGRVEDEMQSRRWSRRAVYSLKWAGFNFGLERTSWGLRSGGGHWIPFNQTDNGFQLQADTGRLFLLKASTQPVAWASPGNCQKCTYILRVPWQRFFVCNSGGWANKTNWTSSLWEPLLSLPKSCGRLYRLRIVTTCFLS